MKAVFALIAMTLLAGCVQRPLNEYDRAAILGASENQALQNAHDAVWNNDEHRDSAKHHRHHAQQQDNGVVYKHGRKGYLDADGNFHSY